MSVVGENQCSQGESREGRIWLVAAIDQRDIDDLISGA